MMGWGELFALASAAIWALAVILFRRSGETLPPFELNLFKNTLGLVLMVPTLLFFHGLSVPEYGSRELVLALLSGFFGIAVADTWYLRALNLMGASRMGIVASLFSPFVIVLSAMFLGESLKPWQYLGFALVMSGIMLVTWRQGRTEVEAADLRMGVITGIGAVFMMAVGVVLAKELLDTQSFLWTVEIRLLGGMLGLMLYMLLRGNWSSIRANFSKPQPWTKIVAGSFLGAYLAMMLWLAGYKLIPASEASVLGESGSSWIVLFAWLFLGEAIGLRKIVGLGLTLTGVAIMLLV